MDKTIDAYKEEVAWYLQHCPQPTEFIEDEEDSNVKASKSRKRRSIEPRLTPVEPVRRIRKRSSQHDHEDEEFEVDSSKRNKVRKLREGKPRPVHFTSGSVDSDESSFIRIPFPVYDSVSAQALASFT